MKFLFKSAEPRNLVTLNKLEHQSVQACFGFVTLRTRRSVIFWWELNLNPTSE